MFYTDTLFMGLTNNIGLTRWSDTRNSSYRYYSSLGLSLE